MDIREDPLEGEAIRRFIREHLQYMFEVTPPESVHALDIESLRAPGMTFWSAWEGGELIGCGALRMLDATSGEIKSMRTAPAWRGRGVGSAVLRHIIAEAERRRYRWLYLETGAMPEFASARKLYLAHGFSIRGPFGDYREDANSVFMWKELNAPR